MRNIIKLASGRRQHAAEVTKIFAVAAEAVLDLYDEVTAGPEGSAAASWLDEQTCIDLIIANAELLRPGLRTSRADRLVLQLLLDGVTMCFGNAAPAN